jgi:hypothetical protein
MLIIKKKILDERTILPFQVKKRRNNYFKDTSRQRAYTLINYYEIITLLVRILISYKEGSPANVRYKAPRLFLDIIHEFLIFLILVHHFKKNSSQLLNYFNVSLICSLTFTKE